MPDETEEERETHWGTGQEVDYLLNMGKHQHGWEELSPLRFQKFRKRLLENYLFSADRRGDWGDINKEEAVDEARSELAKTIAMLASLEGVV